MTMTTLTNRGPLIAFIAAGAALLVAIVGVVVVLMRDDGPRPVAGLPLDDRPAAALDVAALQIASADPAEGPASERGISIRGGAPALGVAADDIVVAITGRPMRNQKDLEAAIQRLGFSDAEVLYVELVRGGKRLLLRRSIQGGMRDAVRAVRKHGTADLSPNPYVPALPATPDPYGGLTPDPYADPADDLTSVIAAITKIDDTTYEIDRSAVDKVLANPMAIAKGARVVPAIKNGKAEGFKLYAIRPNSVYAALGFNNGDTLNAINGLELTSADKALEVYSQLKGADRFEVELTRRGLPVTLSFTIR